MNEKEKAAADSLLDSLKEASPDNAVQIATAYELLTRAAVSRSAAESQY